MCTWYILLTTLLRTKIFFLFFKVGPRLGASFNFFIFLVLLLHNDDGTRVVRIIGCEYRLLESEILDWLSVFGEVISEATEELFEEKGEENAGN